MNSDDEDNCCIRCSNSIDTKLNNCTLALAERLGIRDLAQTAIFEDDDDQLMEN